MMKLAIIVLLGAFSCWAFSSELNDGGCSKYSYMVDGWNSTLEEECLEEMESGNLDATAIVGLHLVDNNDIERGLALLEKAGKRNNNFALYWLGTFHLKGLTPESNSSKSLGYFKKVKGELEMSALISMAVIHAEGHVLPVDMEKAIELFKKAQEILEEPFFNVEAQEKINSNNWLRYQWMMGGGELAFYIDKYKLDIGKVSTVQK